jgi:predicted nucleic acid-binding protein
VDKLFLDANVLIAAAWRLDARVRGLWRLPDIALVVSTYVLDEVARNLQRQEHLDRLEQLLKAISVISNWDHISLPDDVVLREKDIPILQAAIAAEATHLITGDKQDFGPYFGKVIAGVEVIRPADYLRQREKV